MIGVFATYSKHGSAVLESESLYDYRRWKPLRTRLLRTRVPTHVWKFEDHMSSQSLSLLIWVSNTWWFGMIWGNVQKCTVLQQRSLTVYRFLHIFLVQSMQYVVQCYCQSEDLQKYFFRTLNWRLDLLGQRNHEKILKRGYRFVPYTVSENIRHRWYYYGSKYWWNQDLAAWWNGPNLQSCKKRG